MYLGKGEKGDLSESVMRSAVLREGKRGGRTKVITMRKLYEE